MGQGSNRAGALPVPPSITPHPCGFRAADGRALGGGEVSTEGISARTVGTSLLRDGDVLLEEAMEVGLSGTASFLPSGSFSTPFSRDE